MKIANRKHGIAFATVTLVVAILTGIAGADDQPVSPREVIPISLNAGETYVIKNLGEETTPAVHVVKNPNALVVTPGKPGQLVLVGADRGEWTVDVTNADGTPVTYKVDVHSITNFADPTKPGKAPAALGNPMSSSSAATATTASLDPGAGPVDGAGSAAATKVAAAASSSAAATTANPAAAPANAPAATSPVRVASAGGSSAPTGAAPATVNPAALPAAAPALFATAPPPATVPPVAPIKLAEYTPPSPNRTGAGTTAAASPAEGPIIPSQSISTVPRPEKFKTDPLASPYSPSEGGPSGSNFLPNDVVIVMTGSSRVFDFPRRIRRISVADTDVADIQVITPFQINLIGHKEGFTTLAIWDNQGRYEERQVRVDPHGRQQVLLNAIVAELNRGRTEQNGINWSLAFLNAGALPGLSLSNNLGGGPATPFGSTTSLLASCPAGSTTGAILPFGGCLPQMTLSNAMTYGLSVGHTANAFFGYLESHNLGKVLSEPRLLANSGEKAEFLDGGEIPIVITQALNSTIVFKQFGTSVIFVPTVVGKDEIELSVKPEVSQPDYGHGVNLFGFTVPAFVTRRAETDVRLHNDQTLIIAGLILKTPTSTVNKVPYLGDVPWVGNLFKNTSYDNTTSELVMSVTPQIVEPLPNGSQVAEPTSSGPLTAEDIRTDRLSSPDASRPRF